MSQRGRKKGANGERSRNLLLDIAAEEFALKGYHETKISTIVKRADVTQPTFYLYFQSKEAIFQELVDIFRNQLFELIKQSRLESGIVLSYLQQEIREKLTAIFVFFKEYPNVTRIGFFIAPEAEKIKIQMATKITDNLIKEQQDGYFNPNVKMSTVADSLIGIMERLTVTKLFNGIAEPENLANEIVHLLLHGMIQTNEKG